jgi:hypothetical protein
MTVGVRMTRTASTVEVVMLVAVMTGVGEMAGVAPGVMGATIAHFA